jgi:hypothetical protein
VNGKTVTETFSSPASLAKAQREVAECQRFRELGDQLLELNERVCQLRPLEQPNPSSQEKKTVEVIQREIAREVDQLLRVVFSAAQIFQGLIEEHIAMAGHMATPHSFALLGHVSNSKALFGAKFRRSKGDVPGTSR